MEFYKRRDGSSHDYFFEKTLTAGETLFLAMPTLMSLNMGVCDIGWQCNGSISLYATCQRDAENAALWEEVRVGEKIAETATALKIINNGSECTFASRVIMR